MFSSIRYDRIVLTLTAIYDLIAVVFFDSWSIATLTYIVFNWIFGWDYSLKHSHFNGGTN